MRRTLKYISVLFVLVMIFGISGCAGSGQKEDADTLTIEIGEAKQGDETVTESAEEESTENSYTMISMEEAKELFEEEGDYIILDVRTAAEFADGHIPGAINIANEDIGSEEIPSLPDKDQLIYVYCRSGNRSKQAAQKLVDLGYSNIVEFGGIIDWTGDVEK